jgi:GAF domain-containing protein
MTLLSDPAELRGEVELHRRLAGLYRTLTSGHLSETLLAEVVAAAGDALDCKRSAIVARDERGRWHWQMVSGRKVSAGPLEPEVIGTAEAACLRGTPVALDERARKLAAEGLLRGLPASVVTLPLPQDDGTAACLVLFYDAPHGYAPAEIDLAKQVAAGVGACLANLRLLEGQRTIATTLQHSLLRPLPRVSGLELGRASRAAGHPALLGGDFSDVLVLDESHVGLLIGDVNGRGIEAAAFTGTVRSALAAFFLIDPSPAFVLSKTNELLLRREGGERYVTALLCTLDLDSGELSCASAGHPAPLLVGQSRCHFVEVPFGLPLGLHRGTYGGSQATLDSGEGLVLFTDGVSEARRGTQLLGEEGVLATVKALRGCHPQLIAEALLAAAVAFAASPQDDLEVLAVRLMEQLNQSVA